LTGSRTLVSTVLDLTFADPSTLKECCHFQPVPVKVSVPTHVACDYASLEDTIVHDHPRRCRHFDILTFSFRSHVCILFLAQPPRRRHHRPSRSGATCPAMWCVLLAYCSPCSLPPNSVLNGILRCTRFWLLRFFPEFHASPSFHVAVVQLALTELCCVHLCSCRFTRARPPGTVSSPRIPLRSSWFVLLQRIAGSDRTIVVAAFVRVRACCFSSMRFY
jgi:hypothetical protein